MTPDPTGAVETYRIDPIASSMTVQAFAEGLFSVFGHDPVLEVKELSGEAQFVPGTFEHGSVKLSIGAGSLKVVNDVKEKDRLEIERMTRDEVLQVSRFPEIVFTSDNVSLSRFKEGRYRARIIGSLTLHGVTQNNLWISGEMLVTPEGLRAKGEVPIKQSDYQIKLVSVAGGTLKIKNEVKCSFDLLARKV
jgi:polyisoprenoid-binding protein YceI